MARQKPSVDFRSFDPFFVNHDTEPKIHNQESNAHGNHPPQHGNRSGTTAKTTASPYPSHTDQEQILNKQGFPSGIIKAFKEKNVFPPLRLWIVDNSTSMAVNDSHRITGNFDNVQNTIATRWQELQDCIAYQIHFAAYFMIPTQFLLLNDPGSSVGPSRFGIGMGDSKVEHEMKVAKEVITRTQPNGPTHLSAQISHLRNYIASIAPQLRRQNKRVTLFLATQGLPTDKNGVGGQAPQGVPSIP